MYLETIFKKIIKIIIILYIYIKIHFSCLMKNMVRLFFHNVRIDEKHFLLVKSRHAHNDNYKSNSPYINGVELWQIISSHSFLLLLIGIGSTLSHLL